MIHLPEDDKKFDLSEALPAQPSGQPSGSSNIVSSNGQLEANLLIDFGDAPQNANQSLGLGPPPDFTPYDAEHFEVGYSDVVSHDPHLNSDGSFSFQ